MSASPIPVVLATPEALSLRPRVPTLFRFPLALGANDFVYACTCGWLSREHSTEERATKEFCPRCGERELADLRRRHLLARLTVERTA